MSHKNLCEKCGHADEVDVEKKLAYCCAQQGYIDYSLLQHCASFKEAK